MRPLLSPSPGSEGSAARRGLGWVAALLAAALSGGTAPAWPAESGAPPSGSTVRLVSPANGVPVFGEVPILAEVSTPPGVKALKVEVFVDGHRIATLLEAPFKTRWDAAEGADPHEFRVKAYTSDGMISTAKAFTPARLGIQRARVLLVQVYVTLKDRIGRFITDLKQDQFEIDEDGIPQKIALFTTERKPVKVVLLLDVSASMKQEERLSDAIEAAKLFVEALETEDSVSVVTFSDVVQVLQPFTSDRTRVLGAIDSVVPERGTALYDAVYKAARILGEQQEGRRALVLLSDGQDQSFDGLSSGSTRTFDDAISESLRQQVTAYTIGLGEQLDTDYDFNHLHTAKEVLSRLASDTGGRFFAVRRPGRLKRTFQEVLDELRFQYTLGYTPSNERRDGSWRSIQVHVKQPGLRVTARKGYYAPTE